MDRVIVFLLWLLLAAAPALAQVPCPGGVIANCPSPTYLNLTLGGTFTVPGGYVQASALAGYVPIGGLPLALGPAAGPILGVWPNLYFAPSPVLTGTPQVSGAAVAQLEFVRNGTLFTFIGAAGASVGISSAENLPIELANNGYQTRLYIDPTYGNVGIGTTTPGAKLDVASQAIVIEQSYTPSTSSAACTKGTIAWDANYVYVCTVTNTWKRSTLAAF